MALAVAWRASSRVPELRRRWENVYCEGSHHESWASGLLPVARRSHRTWHGWVGKLIHVAVRAARGIGSIDEVLVGLQAGRSPGLRVAGSADELDDIYLHVDRCSQA